MVQKGERNVESVNNQMMRCRSIRTMALAGDWIGWGPRKLQRAKYLMFEWRTRGVESTEGLLCWRRSKLIVRTDGTGMLLLTCSCGMPLFDEKALKQISRAVFSSSLNDDDSSAVVSGPLKHARLPNAATERQSASMKMNRFMRQK